MDENQPKMSFKMLLGVIALGAISYLVYRVNSYIISFFALPMLFYAVLFIVFVVEGWSILFISRSSYAKTLKLGAFITLPILTVIVFSSWIMQIHGNSITTTGVVANKHMIIDYVGAKAYPWVGFSINGHNFEVKYPTFTIKDGEKVTITYDKKTSSVTKMRLDRIMGGY